MGFFKTLRNFFYSDNELFAEILKATSLPKNEVKFGNIKVKVEKGVIGRVGYNHFEGTTANLLGDIHQYTFIIGGQYVPMSLQLWDNRLEAYSSYRQSVSVNLKTGARAYNSILLSQTTAFYDRGVTTDGRRQKQKEFSALLHSLGFQVENNRVIFGTFAPLQKTFLDITPEQFLNDFIAVALLRGHFQGNKRYDLTDEPLFAKLLENTLKNVEQAERDYDIYARTIPLGLRYAVLTRDNSTCQRCGRTPAKDYVVLHIDHKTPFSLGGLTEESNLWVLCADCNLGKSNNFVD